MIHGTIASSTPTISAKPDSSVVVMDIDCARTREPVYIA